jgi:hypothetical protein
MYANRDITVALKCNDFRQHMQQLNFVECLNADKPHLGSTIMKDVQFLQRSNIIDYSMLLGQLKIDLPTLKNLCKEDPSLGQGVFIDDEERAWIIGIIDPLTGFNLQKKLEYSYKRSRYGT